MKQSTKIVGMIASGLLIVSSFSCKKFVDRKPLQATLQDVQASQGSLEAQSLGLYYTLRTYGGFSSLPWIDMHSIRGDDAAKGSDANDGKEVIAEFETFQYTKDDWATDTYWNDHFTMINLANAEIHYGDSLKSNDPAVLRQLGEAHFFRAYSFFELVKAYGQVPLINYYYTNPADGVRQKSTLDSLYAQIDADLDTASRYLPLSTSEYGANYAGRLTSGAANTLWAQAYLFRKNWGKVVSLCNTVITSGQYSLMSNFTDIWKDGVFGQGKNGPESIFEMNAYVGVNGASISSQWQGQDGWGTAQQVRQNGAPLEWNLGWGWNVPTQQLLDAWNATDPNDPRKNMTILFSGQSDGGTAQGGWGATLPAYTDPLGGGGLAQKYWNKKLYTGNDPAQRAATGQIGGSGAASWIDHRILRYADIYLMLAEASNEVGDGPGADSALEKVRNRASGNLGATRTILPLILYTSQAQMRTAIKKERLWELAMEGYRFYDLVRWTPASDGIDAPTVLGPLGYTSRNQFYPIPQPAIDISNGVLKQNPNY